MTYKILFLAGLVALPLFWGEPAWAGHGQYCREFTENVWIGGRLQSAYGTACLQPDGSWQRVTDSKIVPAPAPTVTYYKDVNYVPVARPVYGRRVVYKRPIVFHSYKKRHGHYDHGHKGHHGH